MRNRLLAATAISGLVFFAASPAFAACPPGPFVGTISCPGVDGVGINDITTTNVTINVSGSMFSSAHTTVFRLGTGTIFNVLNGGSVTTDAGASTAPIFLNTGSTVNVNNGGSVTHAGGVALTLFDNTTVNANGVITGTINFNGSTASSAAVNIGATGNVTGDINYSILHAHHTLDLAGTYSGTVTAGNTDDILEITNSGTNNFATGSIGTTYVGFDSFVKSGTGTATLTGTTVRNWSISAGTLAGAYNNAGNITGTGGTFQILNASGAQQDFTGDITGAVNVLKSGGSFIRLTGANTFTGALTVNNATTLILEDAAAASATSGISIDQSTLKFDSGFNNTTYDRAFSIGVNDATFDTGANNVTLSNNITGGAGHDLVKAGTGTLTLNGTNTYGNTIVNAGRLAVNGSTSGFTTTVNNGGTLGGTGNIQELTVNSGGTLAPGNSIGTINAGGIVQFNSGSIYAVEYDNTHADKLIGAGDIIISSGAVLNLTGTTGITYAATSGPYTILQTTGGLRFGQFGTVNNSLAFLDAALTYNAQDVQLTLTRNGNEFNSIAKDDEQTQVANAVKSLGAGNAIYDQFLGLTTTQAQDALDDLSGEHNAGVGTAIAQSTGIIQSTLTTHMTGLTHGDDIGDTAALSLQDPSVYTSAYLEPAAGSASSRMWMQAIGTLGKSDADKGAGTPGQDRHSYGAIGGLDIPYEAGYVGIFAGYERGEVTTNSQGAASDIDNYHLGAYGTKSIWEGVTLSGGLGATYHDIESVRHVTVGALQFSPHGDTHAFTTDAFAELSKPVAFSGIALEPFAGINMAYTRMNGYTETNGGAANLTVDDSSTFNPATILGARFGKQWNAMNLSASLGWQHTLGDIDGKITERFVGGTTDFSAFGAARSRDAAVITLGVESGVASGVQAFAGYDGTLSSSTQDHGFKAGVKIDF